MADFALNDTTTTTYDDVSYTAMITDEVKDALMATVVTPALLDFHDLSGFPSKSVKIPKADKFTAAAVSEGVELANTALTSDSVTFTASEIGIMATITDVLEVSDIPAAHGARLKQLGRAIGDKMDVDICALFAPLTAQVGLTAGDLTLSHLLDAIYNLEVNDAAGLGSIVSVLHPLQTANIRTDLEAQTGVVFTQGGTRTLDKAQNGYFGSWFGVDIFQTTNVADDATSKNGAAFIRGYTFGMAHKWSAKVETMRWAPIRGWVLVATAMVGYGEIEGNAGVEVVAGNT